MTSHGERIIDGLVELMRKLGRKPSRIESAHWIDAYLAANGVKMKRAPRKSGPRPTRDIVFDEIAAIDRLDLAQITKASASSVAGVKKQILEVMPGATPEAVVMEIRGRVATFRRKHPTWELTARTLLKWWAQLGSGPAPESAMPTEPADWRNRVRQLLPENESADYIATLPWERIPGHVQEKIARGCTVGAVVPFEHTA